MKKSKLKGFSIVAAAALLAFGAGFGVTGERTAKAAASNKTAVLDSSYYTRVMAGVPGSAATSSLGASIELDVISSDLKTAENIQWIQTVDPALSYNHAITYTPFAGVTFDFWQASPELNSQAQGLIGGEDTPNTHTKAMNYFADGRITITNQYNLSTGASRQGYYPTVLDAATGELSWNTSYADNFGSTYPVNRNPVGSIEEVKNFLNEGYSYRVDYAWGHATDDGFTVQQEACLDGYSRFNPWYVAYKKPIGTNEWQYCFAIPVWREYGTATATNTVYCGFEICANQPYYRQSAGNGVYDNFGNNVKMEVDNVAIYSLEKDATKTVLDFNEVDETAFAIDDSGIQSSRLTYLPGAGANFANLGPAYRDKYDENIWTSGSYTINSINAPMEAIAKPASRSFKTRQIYTVEYKDRATGETVITRSVLEGLDAIEPTYRETGTLYIWESKATAVAGNTVVYGSENMSPFTVSFDLNGGTGTVAPVAERFGREISLPTEGFAREHYDFVGWAIKTKKGSFQLVSKYTVKDYDDTLYALWELCDYGVKFYDGEKLLYQTQTKALSPALYEGEEPTKAGAKFIGWDGALDSITGDTVLRAQYKENYDESVSDKTATISLSEGANTLFLGRDFAKGKGAVTVGVEFLSVSLGGAKAFVSVGGKSVEVTEWVKSGNTVKAVLLAHGKYEIFVKSVSETTYRKAAEGTIGVPFAAGFYGFSFEVPAGGSFSVTVDELSVYENGLPFVEEFEYGEGLIGGTSFYGNGITLVQASKENTLSVVIADNPKATVLTFVDKATGESLETRRVRAGETAALYSAVGYTVSAEAAELAKLTNITANTTVAVTLTPNSYSVQYHTDGIEDQAAVAFGSSLTLPALAFENGYGIVGWARGQNAVAPEFKAGTTVAMPAENLVLYPVYGYQTFTVTFTDGQGNTLEIREVIYQGTAVYAGETPKKEGYLFKGWSEAVSGVTKDITVAPVFEELPKAPTHEPPVQNTDASGKGAQIALFVLGGVCLAAGAAFTVAAFKKKKKD